MFPLPLAFPFAPGGAAAFGIDTLSGSSASVPEPAIDFAPTNAPAVDDAEVVEEAIQVPISLEVETASRTVLAKDKYAGTLNEGAAPAPDPVGGLKDVITEDPVHGLKDIITDVDNGIEIHVPRTRPGEGTLLSPTRQSQGDKNQFIPSGGGYRGHGDPRAKM